VDAGVDRKREMAHQLLMDGKILAQMMERACLANLDLQAESGYFQFFHRFDKQETLRQLAALKADR
jgi:hypothetical protein